MQTEILKYIISPIDRLCAAGAWFSPDIQISACVGVSLDISVSCNSMV